MTVPECGLISRSLVAHNKTTWLVYLGLAGVSVQEQDYNARWAACEPREFLAGRAVIGPG